MRKIPNSSRLTSILFLLFSNRIKVGFHLIFLGFRKLHITALSWIGFVLSTCLCYASFIIWAKVRVTFSPKEINIRIWDSIWLLLVIGYYIFSFYITSKIVAVYQLGPSSAAIILLEQIRLTMKIHSFVRSNAPKVINYKPHSDQLLNLPRFGNFFYFLFAPTIVYRDETQTIRWNFVAYRILEIGGVIFYYNFLFHRFLIPVYQEFGLRKFSWGEIIISVFENATLGILILLATFFLILHSVQNLFAELLRFGDRMFYKDWWTCTSFSEYFRTWNVVVHDWLYTYVYKDMYEIVTNRNKTISKFAVFVLSAIVHEWVLANMFGFFFPALFIQFFFGGALLSFLTAPKNTVLNILFWYALIFGSGLLISLYTLEFFARNNVPADSSLSNNLLPRFLNCDCIG
ncbi:hypothetical protein NQ317_009429 [Molorchus minor]|uniref:O-acyltransferase n=1 Tax=Molorchus minor TaxID=1323400 RepID=A0ABQ9JI43_9CUCU|nr:hypothetical protein NQ317_009429 [Molorchus minor]